MDPPPPPPPPLPETTNEHEETPTPHHHLPSPRKKRTNVTNLESERILGALLCSVESDDKWKLQRGAVATVSRQLGFTRWQVQAVWDRARLSHVENGTMNVALRKKGRCGRKPKFPRQLVCETVEELPLSRRRNYRDLATALASTEVPCSKATLLRFVKKEKILRNHSGAIKSNTKNK